MTVNEQGDVTEAVAISGPTMLRAAAEYAAKHSKYQPLRRNGKPIQSKTQLRFNFRLEPEADARERDQPRAGDKGEWAQAPTVNGLAMINSTTPQYPFMARLQRVQGPVEVELLINEAGEVVDAQALSGPRPLRAAAERAAREGKFSPYLQNARPMKCRTRITYNFKL